MRLIDADKFNGVIYHIPDDVYDEGSFIRGIEFILDKIREADTVISIPRKDVEPFKKWLENCPIE